MSEISASDKNNGSKKRSHKLSTKIDNHRLAHREAETAKAHRG